MTIKVLITVKPVKTGQKRFTHWFKSAYRILTVLLPVTNSQMMIPDSSPLLALQCRMEDVSAPVVRTVQAYTCYGHFLLGEPQSISYVVTNATAYTQESCLGHYDELPELGDLMIDFVRGGPPEHQAQRCIMKPNEVDLLCAEFRLIYVGSGPEPSREQFAADATVVRTCTLHVTSVKYVRGFGIPTRIVPVTLQVQTSPKMNYLDYRAELVTPTHKFTVPLPAAHSPIMQHAPYLICEE